MMSSGGGQIGGGNPMAAHTILGLPAGGATANAAFRLTVGSTGAQSSEPPASALVTVSGTISEAVTAVTVNGVDAAIVGTTFSAQVPLNVGRNTLTAIATDAAGNTATATATVYLDLADADKQVRFAIEVTGTLDDPSASVLVNGTPATIAEGRFSALVPLTSGYNTLTAIARDRLGNVSTTSIRVFVPLSSQMPAKPTVGTVGDPIPTLTTLSSLTIGGTKTPGTSVWINGVQVVAASDATTWTAVVNLVEGDNALVIVTHNASGIPSTPTTITIVVDNEPPVLTFSPPPKTNFNPVTLKGRVDDSLTTVTINGVQAARSARDFTLEVPLTLGANALHLEALSPNGHRTGLDFTITRGTIPTVQSVTPSDGRIVYAGQAVAIRISAQDGEGDPIEYQALINGEAVAGGSSQGWDSQATRSWTPAPTAGGLQTVTIGVRDAFGGARAQELELFVVHQPVGPP